MEQGLIKKLQELTFLLAVDVSGEIFE